MRRPRLVIWLHQLWFEGSKGVNIEWIYCFLRTTSMTPFHVAAMLKPNWRCARAGKLATGQRDSLRTSYARQSISDNVRRRASYAAIICSSSRSATYIHAGTEGRGGGIIAASRQPNSLTPDNQCPCVAGFRPAVRACRLPYVRTCCSHRRGTPSV